MNIALDRLIEGMIATLRTDIIPHLADSYARGQAVGVIDLLNNIQPRIEWAQQPVRERILAKREVLCEIDRIAPGLLPELSMEELSASAEGLMAEHARLDAAIGDALRRLHGAADVENKYEALTILRKHLHDEQVEEIKKIRKPLFAEIASGSDGASK